MLQDQDPPPYVILGRTRPKARKDYDCCHCTIKIKKGQKHNKRCVIGEDGSAQNIRYHFVCPIEVM